MQAWDIGTEQPYALGMSLANGWHCSLPARTCSSGGRLKDDMLVSGTIIQWPSSVAASWEYARPSHINRLTPAGHYVVHVSWAN